ncbi:MAG: HypC/HybG/HupF family hydrogenase formation chaperone [Chloroflexi bacterium]|nr:HypC/HybG/HupF family hydrogenase formation chaperone [Chloroflexota bacterium]
MCLGIPGKVTELYEANGMKMGKVDFGGVVKEACLEYLPEIEVGDYTIVHVGFGISQLDEEAITPSSTSALASANSTKRKRMRR